MSANDERDETWFRWAKRYIASQKEAYAMFEKRFSDLTIKVLEFSGRAAHSLGHDAIGAEHLLAAFLKVNSTQGAKALADYGFSLEMVRERIQQKWGARDSVSIHRSIPYTPRCKGIVKRACARADKDEGRLVDTEDLFLELIAETEGLSAELFRERGVSIQDLSAAIRTAE